MSAHSRELHRDETPPRCRVFLSYGRTAAGTHHATRLRDYLLERGFDVWQDVDRIRAGSVWDEQIREGIRGSHVLLALLSPHAVRSSTGETGSTSVCLEEIHYARDRIPILPVMMDTCEVPFVISRLQWIDGRRLGESPTLYEATAQAIVSALEDARRGTVRERHWHSHPEPWDYTPVLNAGRAGFHGRTWLMKRITRWCLAERTRWLLIVGDPGIGKSALAAALVRQNPGGEVLAYHFCDSNIPATLEAGRFVQNIAAMTCARIPAYDEALNNVTLRETLSAANIFADPASAFDAGVLAPLARVQRNTKETCYLLIDSLDEALLVRGGRTIVDLVASSLDRFPDWLRVISTTRNDRRVTDVLRHGTILKLDARSEENLRDLSEYVESRVSRSTAIAKRSDRLEAALLRISDGNFLVATTALAALETSQIDQAELADLPKGDLPALYNRFWERMFPRAGVDYAPYRRLFQSLIAAQRSPDRVALAWVLQTGNDEGLSLLLDYVAPFLSHRDGKYTLFHKTLSDWLSGWDEPQDRPLAGVFHANAVAGHERWADACETPPEGSPALARYALEFLPVHLYFARRRAKLWSLVIDGTFGQRQAREFQHQPALPLHSLRLALIACHDDGAVVGVLRCLWTEAPRLLREVHDQTPLEALIAGDIRRATHLADLQEGTHRALQLLVLAWHLDESGQTDEASRMLEGVGHSPPGEMGLAEGEAAAFLLASLARHHRAVVEQLSRPLLDSEARRILSRRLRDEIVVDVAPFAPPADDPDEPPDRRNALVRAAVDTARTVGLDAALQIASEAADDVERSDVVEAMAVSLARAGRVDDALLAAKRIPLRGSQNTAFEAIGVAQARAGSAVAAWRTAADHVTGFDLHQAQLRIGVALGESGRTVEARRYLSIAAVSTSRDISTDVDELRERLAAFQARLGRFDECVATIKQIRSPEHIANALRHLAAAWYARGETDQAFATWDQVLELAPHTPKRGTNVVSAAAKDQMANGEGVRALATIDRLAEVYAKVFYLCEIGHDAGRRSRHLDAEAAFRKARDVFMSAPHEIETWSRPNLLGRIAEGFVLLGLSAEAMATADSVANECHRGQVFARIALEEHRSGRPDHAHAALRQARETLRPLVDIANELFGDGEKFQREPSALNAYRENGLLWVTALRLALAPLEAAEALLEGFAVGGETVGMVRSPHLGLLEAARVLSRAGRSDEATAAWTESLAAARDQREIDKVVDAGIECGLANLAEHALSRPGYPPAARSNRLLALGTAVAAQDRERARAFFLQAVEAARSIPRGSDREGTLWRAAIAMAEGGFGDLALQTARTTDRYRDDYLARLLQAVAKTGDGDTFVQLLADSLADGESSRQAAVFVIDQHPERVVEIAAWVSELN